VRGGVNSPFFCFAQAKEMNVGALHPAHQHIISPSFHRMRQQPQNPTNPIPHARFGVLK
jgi:hypothetical protein